MRAVLASEVGLSRSAEPFGAVDAQSGLILCGGRGRGEMNLQPVGAVRRQQEIATQKRRAIGKDRADGSGLEFTGSGSQPGRGGRKQADGFSHEIRKGLLSPQPLI